MCQPEETSKDATATNQADTIHHNVAMTDMLRSSRCARCTIQIILSCLCCNSDCRHTTGFSSVEYSEKTEHQYQ